MADAANISEAEEWRDVPGFEGLYQVSSEGRVKRLPGLRNAGQGRVARIPERTWPGFVGSPGYYEVSLGRENKRYVHRLVCEVFHGPAPEGKGQVAHFDGNKLNNKARNLRWADWTDNRADDARMGLIKRGVKHYAAMLTEQQVIQIRADAASGESRRSIARRLGFTRQHIDDIVNRRIWKHL